MLYFFERYTGALRIMRREIVNQGKASRGADAVSARCNSMIYFDFWK